MTDMGALGEDIAYDLIGTCDSLEAALERRDASDAFMDSSFCARLDSLAFCCETCDWWFEIGEMADNDQWVCESCGEDD